MFRSADPSNRSGKYCQSQTRVSVSEPLVRWPRERVEEPSPWSRSSFTFLPGRTVGREHRPNSRSVHVHSAAILTHRRVGPTGTDFSIDGGRRWQPLSDEGFHSVAFAGPTLGWAAGDNGRVGRLTGYAFQPVPR